MDIPVLKSQVSQLTSQPVSAATLFEQLAQAGSVQARVALINHTQTVLTSALGQILTSGSPELRVGDRLTLSLDSNSRTPTLKIDNIIRSPVNLDISRNRPVSDLFSNTGQVLAVVKKQDQSGTLIEAGNSRVKLEPLPGFKAGQLVSLVKSSDGNNLEVFAVNHQQVLKSAISNLIPAQKTASTASALVQLARLIQDYVALDKNLTTSSVARLLNSLPEANKVNKSILKDWIEFTIKPNPGKTERSPTTQNPFQLIQNLISQKLAVISQSKQLSALSNAEVDRLNGPISNNEILQALGRELVKLSEQSSNQQLFQQSSLRLQQEQQQPLLLHLAIPLQDHGKTTELGLMIRQRKPDSSKDNQIWDIHLDFELANLGQISTHLSLSDNTVSASFWSEKIETQQKIESAIGEFQTGISRAGLIPGKLRSFHGKPMQQTRPDIPTIPDMLVDVRV